MGLVGCLLVLMALYAFGAPDVPGWAVGWGLIFLAFAWPDEKKSCE